MVKFLTALFATIAVSCVMPNEAMAQMCRIRCGFNNSGGVVFKEVYEYDYVDEKPEYPGSDTALMKFINENRNYPKNAYRHGVEGRVICSFVVNADGKVSNIEVIKGVESSLNAEAVRILSLMPDWHPGKIGGRAVPVRVIHPVPFRR